MPALPTWEYADVDAVLARLVGQPDGAITAWDQRPAVQRRVRAASKRINEYTRRVFLPTTLTRQLDVPAPGMLAAPGWPGADGTGYAPVVTDWVRAQPNATIYVPDLQSVVSLTAFGVSLTPDDYQLIRYTDPAGSPLTTALIRVLQGVPVSWYIGATTPWQPAGAITLTGVFCYDPTGVIPDEIVTVCEALVLKDWGRYIRLYAAGPNSTDDVTLDADLSARLDAYKADTSTEYPL